MSFHASCYCGEVHLEVQADTSVRTVFCHCTDCRRAHSAPLYQCSYCPEQSVTITRGSQHLKYHQGTNTRLQRFFCGNCGTHVYNALHRGGEERERGVFVSLFDVGTKLPESWNARYHVWCKEAILPMELFSHDGLPKNSHNSAHPNNVLY